MTKGPSEAAPQGGQVAWEPDTEAQAAPVGGEWRAWAPGAHTPPEERQRSRSPSRGGARPPLFFRSGASAQRGQQWKEGPTPSPRGGGLLSWPRAGQLLPDCDSE